MGTVKPPKECLVCLNPNETIFVPTEECQKIFNICCSYVKDAINVEFLINNISANNNQLSFCINCFHSSFNLSLLVEQLSKLKKEINDLASSFSEKIGKQRIQAKANSAEIQLKDGANNYQTANNQRTCPDSWDRLSLLGIQVDSGSCGRDSVIHSETSSSKELIDEQIAINEMNSQIVKTENEDTYLNSEDESGTDNVNCFKDQEYETKYLMGGIENERDPLEENESESPIGSVNNCNNTVIELRPKVGTSKPTAEWVSSATIPNIALNRIQNDQDYPGTNFNQNIPSGSVPNFNCPTKITSVDFQTNQNERRNYKYNCSTCLKNFESPSKLKRHSIVHTGEKPYKCAWCENLFARPDKLKEHERIHTGDKPYKCCYCELTFISSNAKVRHQKKVHRDRYMKKS